MNKKRLCAYILAAVLPMSSITAMSAPFMFNTPSAQPSKAKQIKTFGQRVQRFLKNHGREMAAGATGITLGTLAAYLLANYQAKREIAGMGNGIRKTTSQVMETLSRDRDAQLAAWQKHTERQRAVLKEMKKRLAEHESHDNLQFEAVRGDYQAHLGDTKTAYDASTQAQKAAIHRLERVYRENRFNLDRAHKESLVRQSIQAGAERQRMQEAAEQERAVQAAREEKVQQGLLLKLGEEGERNREAVAGLQDMYIKHNQAQADSFIDALDRNQGGYQKFRQKDDERFVRFEQDSYAWREQSAAQHQEMLNATSSRFDKILKQLADLDAKVSEHFAGMQERVSAVGSFVGDLSGSLQMIDTKIAQYQNICERVAASITELQHTQGPDAPQLTQWQAIHAQAVSQVQRLAVLRGAIEQRQALADQQARVVTTSPRIEDVTNEEKTRKARGKEMRKRMDQFFAYRVSQQQQQIPAMQSGSRQALTDYTPVGDSRALVPVTS